MADPAASSPTVGAAPWYKSPVFIAALVTFLTGLGAAVPKVGKFLGVINATQLADLISNGLAVISIAAGGVTMKLRVQSKIQPLTLTRAAASEHPSTVMARTDPISAEKRSPEDLQ